MLMSKEKTSGLAIAVLSGMLFGTASIFVRYANQLDSFFVSAQRLSIGALVVLLFVMISGFLKHKTLKLPKLLNYKSILFLSVVSGTHFLSFVIAMKTGLILRSLIIVNSAPVLVLIIKYVIYQKAPSKFEILAILLAFAGITILITEGHFSQIFAYNSFVMSDFWAFLCAVSYAAYIIKASKYRRKLASADIMFTFFLSGAILLWIVFFAAQIHEPTDFASISAVDFNKSLVFVILLGLVPTGIGHFLFNYSFRFMPVLTTATITVLEPVTGGIYAAVLFPDQTLGTMQFVGIALSICGLIIISIIPAKSR